MSGPGFVPFPKIARLHRKQIFVVEQPDNDGTTYLCAYKSIEEALEGESGAVMVTEYQRVGFSKRYRMKAVETA